MISERAENDSAEGALKKDRSKYLHGKKRPPRLPDVPAFCSGQKKNKIKNIVSASGKIAKRGVWLGKNEGLSHAEEEEVVLLSPESIDDTEHSTANIFTQANRNQHFLEEDAVVDHLCDDSDDDDDDNWIEEWGAVTIQSLFRGHYTRKKVKRLKKRMLKVKQMKKHRRYRKRSKDQRSRVSEKSSSRTRNGRRTCSITREEHGDVVKKCKTHVNQTIAGDDNAGQQSLKAKPRRRLRKVNTIAASSSKRRIKPSLNVARPSTATVRDALAQLTIMRKKKHRKLE